MIKDTTQDFEQIKANYLCKVRLHQHEYPVQDPGFQNL